MPERSAVARQVGRPGRGGDPAVHLKQIDYPTLSLTDRNWFYLTTGGAPKPEGGGTFHPIETRFNPVTDVAKIAIVRAPAPVLAIDVTFRDPTDNPATDWFRFQSPQFRRLGFDIYQLSGAIEKLITVPAQSEVTERVTLTAFPNIVTYGSLWADVSGPGYPPQGLRLLQNLYIVESQPVGHMQVPWTEVLDHSCGFAEGTYSAPSVRAWLTRNLFASGALVYNDGQAPQWLVLNWLEQETPLMGKFTLRDFFETSILPRPADCRDVSSYLSLLFSSQGLSMSLRVLRTGLHSSDDPPIVLGVRTNPIDGIGSPISYQEWLWNFHQIVESSGAVFDACAAQYFDLAGVLWLLPAYGWALAGYWQTYISQSEIYGLVVGYAVLPAAPSQVPGVSIPATVGVFPFDWQNEQAALPLLQGVF